ncbi:MAG: PVC-type heme-binding CxxCH protein [Pirellulaceae bacterium]
MRHLLLLFCLLSPVPCLLSSAVAEDDPFALGVRTTPWLKPEEEQKKFKLPEGFEINLVAAEPDIQKPLNMQFDEKGRIWLTCSVEYPYAAPLDKPARDSIRVLEDTDGDGRFEKVTVFADGLNIPIGIYPWKGGCIAWSIPNIWHFEDTDGDLKCDKRTKLYGPFDHTRDVHGNCNAFRRGFDGWVYACHGFNNDSHVKGKDGNEVHLNSGNTFRFKLDGSRIEHFTHGQVNPFGMCFDELFNIFTADCHSKPIYQLLRGGYYPSFGKPDDGLGFVPPMMDHLHGSTAICGLTTYTGDNFPKEYRGQFFSGNVMTSRINRNKPDYHGSTIKAIEQPDFLSTSDPWFRPVDIHIGPDGAMYILDFYNRIIGHYEVPLPHPGRDRTSGRIWRVAYTGKAEGTKPAKMPGDLTKMTPAQLVDVLGSTENLTYRLLAQHWLADVVAKSKLQELIKIKPEPHVSRMLHLSWIINAVSPQTDEEIIELINVGSFDANRPLQRVTSIHDLKALAERRDWSENVHAIVDRCMSVECNRPVDSDFVRAAVEAAAQHPRPERIPLLSKLLAKTSNRDELMKYAIRQSLKSHISALSSAATLDKLSLTPSQKSEIASICLAIQSSIAGEFLVDYLKNEYEPRDARFTFLQHACRFAPKEKVPSLIKFARGELGDNPEAEFRAFDSLYQGLQKRGVFNVAGPDPTSSAVEDWGEELARKLLSLDKEDAVPWTNYPVEGLPASESPWVLRQRVSQDVNKDAFFFDSLPKGEQKTGIYRSSSFSLPAKLSFWCAGHDTIPSMPLGKKNFIQLKDAKTGEVLASASPPRNDTAQKIQWDLSQHKDKTGYIEIVDGDTTSGYAWLAVGRFSIPGLNPSKQSQHQIAAAEIAGKLKLQSLRGDFVKILVATNTDGAARGAIGQMLLQLAPDSRAAALVAVIGDPILAENLRPKLGEAIAGRDAKKLDEALKLAVKEVPHRLQTTMAEILAGDKDGIESLLALVNSGNLSPRLLTSPNVSTKLQTAASDDQKKKVTELTASLPSVNEQIEKLLTERRANYAKANTNLENGAALFTKHCAACHQIEGKGAVVGPQLDGIGLRGVERLIEDLLDPNRNVDVAFRTTTLMTDDGQVYSALVRREEGALLVLVDNKGKEFTLPKASIERQQKTGLSLMPSNVQEIVTPQEFFDLVGYLASKKARKE